MTENIKFLRSAEEQHGGIYYIFWGEKGTLKLNIDGIIAKRAGNVEIFLESINLLEF